MTEIDLLRFVAALSVLFFHYMGSDGRIFGQAANRTFPTLAPVFQFGSLGVVLFFAISGFVILMSAWNRSVEEFAVSRIVRLFPAYWFAVALVAVVSLLTGLPASVKLTSPQFLTNFTMMQQGLGVPHALPVFWTLWIELRFYVLIGLLVLVGINYRRVVGFMSVWLLLTAMFGTRHVQVLDQILVFTWSPYFIGGMAAFLIRRYGSSLLPWLLFITSWLMALRFHGTAVWGRAGLPLHHQQQMIELGLITVIFVVMALVALGALKWLRWRRLTVLGALTYPLYLIHHWVGEIVVAELGLKKHGVAGVLVALVTALTLAYLIYRLVEMPGQRLLKKGLRHSLTLMREASDGPESPTVGSTGPRQEASDPVGRTGIDAAELEPSLPGSRRNG
jgi:peptidoglycan/LPS O-acetylase OafA/YrhL